MKSMFEEAHFVAFEVIERWRRQRRWRRGAEHFRRRRHDAIDGRHFQREVAELILDGGRQLAGYRICHFAWVLDIAHDDAADQKRGVLGERCRPCQDRLADWSDLFLDIEAVQTLDLVSGIGPQWFFEKVVVGYLDYFVR